MLRLRHTEDLPTSTTNNTAMYPVSQETSKCPDTAVAPNTNTANGQDSSPITNRGTTTLFVYNLPYSVNLQMLETRFRCFGPVKEVRIAKWPGQYIYSAFSFINLMSLASCEMVILRNQRYFLKCLLLFLFTDTRRSRGYGFVTFESWTGAQITLQHQVFTPIVLSGRILVIQKSKTNQTKNDMLSYCGEDEPSLPLSFAQLRVNMGIVQPEKFALDEQLKESILSSHSLGQVRI